MITIDAKNVRSGEFDMFKVVDLMKRKPGIYTGDPTPEKLYVFLAGYGIAMEHAGFNDASEPTFGGFHDWVAKKFGFYESTAGWPNMIMAVLLGLNPATISCSDIYQAATDAQNVEAVALCFNLMDEYRQVDQGHNECDKIAVS